MHIDMGIYSDIFAVPTCIVDRYLKLTNGPTLKILMALLRYSGEDISVEKISEVSGLSRAEIIDGLSFWEEQGIIGSEKIAAAMAERTYKNEAIVVPLDDRRTLVKVEDSCDETVAETGDTVRRDNIEDSSKSNVIVLSKTVNRPGITEAMERMNESEEIQCLVNETVRVLETQNNGSIVTSLVMLHDWAGIPAAVLMMIVHYCKSVGIVNMRRIEKMCLEFQNRGVKTPEDALEVIEEKTVMHQNQNAVRSAFGIGGRALSPTESNYINSWFLEMGFTTEFIELAYNKTIDTIGKLSFSYTNKILASWKEKGITTIENALADVKENKLDYKKNDAKSVSNVKQIKRKYTDTSYDLDELERDAIYNTPKL